MTEATGDRRARRSRKLLKQGLLELLREKRFAHISVREIAERMDLNRGTFYLHYPDTTALMRDLEADLLGEIQTLVDAHMQETVEGRSLRPVFEPMLDYVVAHRETCAALFNSDSASGFLNELQGVVYRNGVRLLGAWGAAEGGQTSIPLADQPVYLLSFLAYGLVGLMKTWFDQGMALPREDLLRAADAMASGAALGLSGGTEYR